MGENIILKMSEKAAKKKNFEKLQKVWRLQLKTTLEIIRKSSCKIKRMRVAQDFCTLLYIIISMKMTSLESMSAL